MIARRHVIGDRLPESPHRYVFAVLEDGDHWPVGRIRRRWLLLVESTPWGRPLTGQRLHVRRRRAAEHLIAVDEGPADGRL